MSVVTRIRTSAELTVPFTREDVWAVLADVAAYPEWWPARLRVEVRAEREGILGSEIEVRPVMGRSFRIRIEEIEGIHSLRLRFVGGSLEGQGGFHLRSVDGATHVRYEMDVFARGLNVALLSQVTPLHLIHSSRMRGVLRNLASRLKRLRKAADLEASRAARTMAQEEALARPAAMEAERRTAEAARKGAEEETAARAAAESAARVAAEKAERRAAEEAACGAAEEEARKKAEEDARKRAEEEAAARVAAEEAERWAAEEAARRAVEETAWRRTDDDAARRMADQVMARAAADEAAAGPDVRAAGPPHDSIGPRIRAALDRIGEWFREPPGPTPPLNPGLDAVATAPSILPESNFEAARRYINALSSTATPEEIGAFFVANASQEEFPHRLLKTSLTRGLPEILEARARALTVFKSQRHDITGATGGGSHVAMEVRFQGTVGSTGDGFVEGQDLEARLAIFLKFADGRIVRQRSYACFEPWATQAERRVILDERLALAGQFVPAAPQGLRAAAPQGSNFDRARSHLDALNARADAETIASFFAPDAVQEELPNRFTPAGAWRDLEGIKRARVRSLAAIFSEDYELMGATGGGSQVALEIHWTATVGEGGADLDPGQRIEARVAMFLTFRDGLIVRQRIYDCV